MAKSRASDRVINGDRQSSLKVGGGGTWRNPVRQKIVLKRFNLSRRSEEL